MAGVTEGETRLARLAGIGRPGTDEPAPTNNNKEVHQANFLETVPTGDFDVVVANPPFAAFHYAKHVEHAMKFLKPDGKLICILPITARYDHGLVDGSWQDLPVGSFSESGTNINTTKYPCFCLDIVRLGKK